MTPPPIVINNWQKGIAPSQAMGFANMLQCDISNFPGIVRPNYDLEKKSGTTITGLVKWIVRNSSNGHFFSLDTDRKVYTSTDSGSSWSLVSGNTTTAGTGTGNGLAIWKDYLFVMRNTAVDIYGPLSGVPAWTNGWGGLTLTSDTFAHPALWGQDDILYIGNQRYVASVQEVPGATFDPATAATYTATAQALDLPANYRVRCLAELADKLMIGTWVGTSLGQFKIADIFPWDRVSPSFDLPLKLGESGVASMVTKDNILYVRAGTSGKLFATNGSSVRQVAEIPLYISQLDGGIAYEDYPGAMCIHYGRVFWGASILTTQGRGCGVWSYDPDTGVLNRENSVSTGDDTNIEIGALFSVFRDSYVVGWRDNTATAQGIDKLLNDSHALDATIESQEFWVGNMIHGATYSKMTFELSKPLVSGESVNVYWRPNRSANYNSGHLGTFDEVGPTVFDAPASIENVASVQVRVILAGRASAASGPELRELRIE